MAEIHMEKKREGGGLGWLWILLALLLIALLAWAFWPDDEVEPVVEPVATATYVAPVEPVTPTTTLGDILQNPQQWVGQEYSGIVTVPEVPTDRGFWVEENGQRVFAILYDAPAEKPLDINPGQQLRIRGTVRDQAYLSQLPGEPLTAGTQNIAQNQQVYLVVGESAIEILQPGQS